MILFKQCEEQLLIFQDLLKNVNAELYIKPSIYLHNATIGQHSRHIIEMVLCMYNGYETEEIDYINRTRNLKFENDIKFAESSIKELIQHLYKPNKNLSVKLSEPNNPNFELVNSNYYREVLYNTDHITHHLALIKVALIEFNVPIENRFFGVAYSTIQYKTNQ